MGRCGTVRSSVELRDVVVALILALAVFTVMAGLMWASPFVGSSDSASAAEVGRNLARGEGYSTHIVWRFFERTPQTHPEDAWPLSQPTLIAMSMSVLGQTAFAAKVVNALWLALLGAATYALSRRLGIQESYSIVASVLTVTVPVVFLYSLYCMSHTGAMVLTLVLVHVVLWATGERGAQDWRRVPAVGIVLGVLVLQRPYYVFMLAPAWLLLAAATKRGTTGPWPRSRALVRMTVVLLLTVGIVVSPLVVRNWREFDHPSLTPSQEIIAVNRTAGVWDQEVAYRVYLDVEPPTTERSLRGWLGHAYRVAETTIFGLRDGRVVTVPLLIVGSLGFLILWKSRQVVARRVTGFVLASLVACSAVLVYGQFQAAYLAWLAPFLGVGAVLLISRVAQAIAAKSRSAAAVVVLLAVVFTGGASLAKSREIASASLQENPAVVAAEYLDSVGPSAQAVLTDRPWEIAFHADRPTVKLPLDEPGRIRQVADYYDAEYLVLADGYSSPDRARILSAWDDGNPRLVFEAQDLYVYRVAVD